MKNLKFIAGLLIVISFAASTFCLAQDSTKIVILSDKIGAIVNAKEREEYKILPKFGDDFISAIFYVDSDNRYYCKVRLKDGNSFKDSIISYSYYSIKNIAVRVQTKEKGVNFNPYYVKLKLNDGSILEDQDQEINLSESDKVLIGYLPLAETDSDYSQFIEKSLEVGLTTGIIITSYDYKELSHIFHLIAQKVVRDPSQISESDFAVNSFPLFSFSSMFILHEIISIEFEYSFGSGTKGSSSVSYESFTGSVAYLYPLSHNVSPYLSIGYKGFNFTASQNYGLPIVKDSVGTLESISLNGKGGGLKLSVGVIYKISDFFSINLFGGYVLSTQLNFDKKYSSYIENNISYNADGFEIGFKLLFR